MTMQRCVDRFGIIAAAHAQTQVVLGVDMYWDLCNLCNVTNRRGQWDGSVTEIVR